MTILSREYKTAEISIGEGVCYAVLIYQEGAGPAFVGARLHLSDRDEGFGVAMSPDKAENLAAALCEAANEARRLSAGRSTDKERMRT
jgi:hypothetical protein